MHVLGEISKETFLRDYWQKKPLLIRQAFPDFYSPVTREDLYELAGEACVESRIVEEKNVKGHWQVQYGPFESGDLYNLPSSAWTLLIQGLDHWLEEASDLLDCFRFIPNWRIDDVMASYAVDGGSVGPHYDQYDVFLLQAAGARNWKIGPRCDDSTPRLSGTPLRILRSFDTEEEWLLEPGDMLYLPPSVAHYGVARGECITLSIGFRTPSIEELTNELCTYVTEQLPSIHLPDTSPSSPSNPGEITPEALASIRSLITEHVLEDQRLATWFGTYATRPKSEDIVLPPDDTITQQELKSSLSEAEYFYWNEGSRYAYSVQESEVHVFIDGHCYSVPLTELEAIQRITAKRRTEAQYLAEHLSCEAFKHLLLSIINAGSAYLD